MMSITLKKSHPVKLDTPVRIRTPVFFGVVYENLDGPMSAAILRDILSMISILDTHSQLHVVSPHAEDLEARFGHGLPDVKYQNYGMDSPGIIWKAYYVNSCPPHPMQRRFDYKLRIKNPEKKTINLTDRHSYPVLERPNQERMLPPGQSPSFMRVPPRYATPTVPLTILKWM